MPRDVPTPRVEMVLPSLIPAGMEMVTSRLARRLSQRGWDVGITCLIEDGELAAEVRRAGIEVTTVREPGFVGNVWPRHLTPWLRSRRADVVHVHSGAWIKGAHAARLAGIARVVFTEHGLLDREPFYSDVLKRWGARYCDWVAAVSLPLEAYLRRAGIPAHKLRVVRNGVDVRTFAPRVRTGGLHRELGLGDIPLIGHVARLAPEKNQRILLESFAKVLDSGSDAHLVIIGDGPLRAELEQLAAARFIANRVHFLGVRQQMESVYPEFDLFVLTSTAEGLSMSILEAMATGRAIVATSVGGTPELLDNGQCGDLVPPGDEAGLAKAMERLLRDGEERARLGTAARARAVTTYSEERMVDAYVELYGRVNAGRSVGVSPCAE